MTRIDVGRTFLMENIYRYVQFDGMVYQQIVGRDFMYDLHKSKRHDLIDLFYGIFRYLDDIFTLNLRTTFPIYIQQNFG